MTASTTRHRIGLVGAGIGTSLSPALHNREAADLGLTDYRYEVLDIDDLGVPAADAGRLVREYTAQGWTGFNITHPCKQTVIGALDELSDNARLLGAVNTVVIENGKLIGHNTDHSGFLAGLRSGLPDARLDTVQLVGAGGAGAAVAYALAAAGVRDLRIADVDTARAADVCGRVSTAFAGTVASAVPLDEVAPGLASCTGLVNATPIGMVGHPGSPVDPAALHPGLWVADVVYRPLHTELLDAADRAGCAVLDGGRMLVAQAADTFGLLTGRSPDRARMRAHLAELLDARQVAAGR